MNKNGMEFCTLCERFVFLDDLGCCPVGHYVKPLLGARQDYITDAQMEEMCHGIKDGLEDEK